MNYERGAFAMLSLAGVLFLITVCLVGFGLAYASVTPSLGTPFFISSVVTGCLFLVLIVLGNRMCVRGDKAFWKDMKEEQQKIEKEEDKEKIQKQAQQLAGFA